MNSEDTTPTTLKAALDQINELKTLLLKDKLYEVQLDTDIESTPTLLKNARKQISELQGLLSEKIKEDHVLTNNVATLSDALDQITELKRLLLKSILDKEKVTFDIDANPTTLKDALSLIDGIKGLLPTIEPEETEVIYTEDDITERALEDALKKISELEGLLVKYKLDKEKAEFATKSHKQNLIKANGIFNKQNAEIAELREKLNQVETPPEQLDEDQIQELTQQVESLSEEVASLQANLQEKNAIVLSYKKQLDEKVPQQELPLFTDPVEVDNTDDEDKLVEQPEAEANDQQALLDEIEDLKNRLSVAEEGQRLKAEYITKLEEQIASQTVQSVYEAVEEPEPVEESVIPALVDVVVPIESEGEDKEPGDGTATEEFVTSETEEKLVEAEEPKEEIEETFDEEPEEEVVEDEEDFIDEEGDLVIEEAPVVGLYKVSLQKAKQCVVDIVVNTGSLRQFRSYCHEHPFEAAIGINYIAADSFTEHGNFWNFFEDKLRISFNPNERHEWADLIFDTNLQLKDIVERPGLPIQKITAQMGLSKEWVRPFIQAWHANGCPSDIDVDEFLDSAYLNSYGRLKEFLKTDEVLSFLTNSFSDAIQSNDFSINYLSPETRGVVKDYLKIIALRFTGKPTFILNEEEESIEIKLPDNGSLWTYEDSGYSESEVINNQNNFDITDPISFTSEDGVEVELPAFNEDNHIFVFRQYAITGEKRFFPHEVSEQNLVTLPEGDYDILVYSEDPEFETCGVGFDWYPFLREDKATNIDGIDFAINSGSTFYFYLPTDDKFKAEVNDGNYTTLYWGEISVFLSELDSGTSLEIQCEDISEQIVLDPDNVYSVQEFSQAFIEKLSAGVHKLQFKATSKDNRATLSIYYWKGYEGWNAEDGQLKFEAPSSYNSINDNSVIEDGICTISSNGKRSLDVQFEVGSSDETLGVEFYPEGKFIFHNENDFATSLELGSTCQIRNRNISIDIFIQGADYYDAELKINDQGLKPRRMDHDRQISVYKIKVYQTLVHHGNPKSLEIVCSGEEGHQILLSLSEELEREYNLGRETWGDLNIYEPSFKYEPDFSLVAINLEFKPKACYIIVKDLLRDPENLFLFPYEPVELVNQTNLTRKEYSLDTEFSFKLESTQYTTELVIGMRTTTGSSQWFAVNILVENERGNLLLVKKGQVNLTLIHSSDHLLQISNDETEDTWDRLCGYAARIGDPSRNVYDTLSYFLNSPAEEKQLIKKNMELIKNYHEDSLSYHHPRRRCIPKMSQIINL
tara:strand:+ start:741 stop:4526 length:3786 start_codon:yes stop_codon:yes gene_type:complete